MFKKVNYDYLDLDNFVTEKKYEKTSHFHYAAKNIIAPVNSLDFRKKPDDFVFESFLNETVLDEIQTKMSLTSLQNKSNYRQKNNLDNDFPDFKDIFEEPNKNYRQKFKYIIPDELPKEFSPPFYSRDNDKRMQIKKHLLKNLNEKLKSSQNIKKVISPKKVQFSLGNSSNQKETKIVIPFDSKKKRIVDPLMQQTIENTKIEEKSERKEILPKWKIQSMALRTLIKSSRGEKMDYMDEMIISEGLKSKKLILCEFCGRKFREEAAEKHIKLCQEKWNILKIHKKLMRI